ncbi:Melibiase family protein [Aphelenchoides avenae]|nr:Melibiase family protein [Aphelenchus avenae]
MSWTKFYCEVDCERHPFGCINEQLYKDMADRMAEDGYREAGYEYVHIDDCWMAYNRTDDGKLVANQTRFPSGIPALADYVHNLGLKFAIYEDIGTKTCGGYPGSAGHLKQDAQTFADWNVDYLKLDGCYIEEDDMPKVYPEMSKYLLSSGRPIVYSCSWPAYLIQKPDKVNYSVIAKYCNLWRNFDDISRSWQSILSIVDWYTANQDKLIPANGPGQWNDPDMIIVGNTEITPDQGRVQMSLWSIWSAPLIMSNDLRTIDPESLEILLNRRVIAIDQDPLGIMGRMVLNISTVSIYVKPVTPVDTAQKLYSYAVAVFNRGTQPVEVEFKLSDIGLKYSGGYDLQDLWSGKKLGRFMRTDKYKAKLRATSVDFFKATLGGLQRKIPKFEIEQDSV